MQRAQVRQWIDFSSFEIYEWSKSLVYPTFWWKQYCKEYADKSNYRIRDLLKVLDTQLKDKNYILGDALTLADASWFNKLKLFSNYISQKI